ncbi:MAG TPA: ATP-binding protein [Polyangiaceae bacterium]|nr:ATP-binding protein [Polyangiaceae bacterium]
MSGSFDLLEHVPLPAYGFRVAPDGDFVLESVNAAGRAGNPAIVKMLGRSISHLYGDQPQTLQDAQRAVREKTTVVRETAVRRYDRTEATLLVRLSYVYVEPAHLVIYMQDVSTPPIAEAALRETEARYRTLVDSMPDGVLLRGADGRVLACNGAVVALHGVKTEFDLLGSMATLRGGVEIRAESGQALSGKDLPSFRVLETGVAEVGSHYELHSDHAPSRWFRVSAQPLHSSTGAITGSVTTFTDITDRIAAQEAIKQGKDRLDLALAAAKMGVWEIDATTKLGFWSQNLSTIFRLPLRLENFAEFLGSVHPDDRGTVLSTSERASAAAHGDTLEQEFRIVGKDMVTRWARALARVLHDGGKIRMVGTIMDVTEQHRLEEELRRAHRLESIGRLAGGIAHDFNNLLAAMVGALELVEDQCPPGAMEDLATIRHGASRATELTRQLLAFARKQPVTYKVVDLSAMVTNVERMLARLVGADIELAISSDTGVHVKADASLLEQVLVNLVVNAREAMPTGGHVGIRVGTTTEIAPISGAARVFALLEVSDSGVGMDEDTRTKIFDPFFTTKASGTGLGLASSYGIVKQHGGHIDVDTRPGHGTRFRVLLPLLPNETARDERSPVKSPLPGRGRVLVVDDEELVRLTIVRMLKSLGYEVLSASSGAEALECSRSFQGHIDAVVCDVAMPAMDGPTVVRELLKTRPGLQVLFASGYAPDDQLLDGKAFLAKPYTRADLASKLHELLSSR